VAGHRFDSSACTGYQAGAGEKGSELQRIAALCSEIPMEAEVLRNETGDIALNLNAISAGYRSVAELCRLLGFNRQQFSRYLTGESQPSRHNLSRIAEGLGIPVADLQGSHKEFLAKHMKRDVEGTRWPLFHRAFPGELQKLRPLLGYYHGYFAVPGLPDLIVRSLVRLHEVDGKVVSKSIERRSLASDATGYISKYQGLASFLGGCIFVVEFEYLTSDSIVETVLFPPYRKKLDILSGLTFGLTSRIHRQPFSSPIVWKFLGRSIDVREALARCGRILLTDRTLPPSVRRTFQNDAKTGIASIFPQNP
jgi:transcriptional regulator with XRE-family HTH domain